MMTNYRERSNLSSIWLF